MKELQKELEDVEGEYKAALDQAGQSPFPPLLSAITLFLRSEEKSKGGIRPLWLISRIIIPFTYLDYELNPRIPVERARKRLGNRSW